MALPPFPGDFIAQQQGPTIPAPSNRLTEYAVDVTTSSDLAKINVRVLITRFSVELPPTTFEMLMTQEQYAIFCQIFRPF